MTEDWKLLPFTNYYEVSTFGNIRNSKTKCVRKIDISKLKVTKTRIRVNGILDNDGNKKNFYLHRLIALTFIPNPLNLNEVNHIDGNPYNNCVNNLEWISRVDNMKHFHTNNPKYTCKYMRKVLLINKENNVIEQSFKCVEECIEKLNLSINYNKLYKILSNSKNKYKDRYKNKDTNKEPNKHTNNYVGVTWNNINKKFIVYHKNKYIGSYIDEIEAAMAYDNKIRELYGNSMGFNFPDLNNNETQAIVRHKNCQHHNDTNEFVVDDNKFLKFEDNNSNIIYDNDSDIIYDNDSDSNSDNDSDNNSDNGSECESEGENNSIDELDEQNIILDCVKKTTEWREISEAPLYQVSNTGLVKLTRLNRLLNGTLITGYKSVTLKITNDKHLCRLVHRLVAEAFIENEDETRLFVDHIDTNKLNNNVSNLRWVSYKENMNNVITKQNISEGKLKFSKKIYQIDIDTKEITNTYTNFKELESNGLKYVTVNSITNFYNKNNSEQIRQKTYKGKYIFLYEEDLIDKEEHINTAKNVKDTKIKNKVFQIDKNTNEIINNFESLYEASKSLNISYSSISQVYNYYKYDNTSRPPCYKTKSTNGFIFK